MIFGLFENTHIDFWAPNLKHQNSPLYGHVETTFTKIDFFTNFMV